MFKKTTLSFFQKQPLLTHFVVACLLGATFVGCRCTDTRQPEANNDTQSDQQVALLDQVDARPVTVAFSEIHSLKDNRVAGTVTFTKVAGGVRIVADVTGLTPGEHGFHVHEHGSCEGDGTSAGGHYNPTNSKHGGPDSPERHVGDFGNLVADNDGKAHYDRIDTLISLEGEHSIIGKSLVIHADRDDFVTQPTGNSGARIGCGLIKAK